MSKLMHCLTMRSVKCSILILLLSLNTSSIELKTFFTEVLLTNAKPIGKIVSYALRIEFQMRGSPHLHALIWCDDCPKQTHDNKQAYIDYIDKHVQQQQQLLFQHDGD